MTSQNFVEWIYPFYFSTHVPFFVTTSYFEQKLLRVSVKSTHTRVLKGIAARTKLITPHPFWYLKYFKDLDRLIVVELKYCIFTFTLTGVYAKIILDKFRKKN